MAASSPGSRLSRATKIAIGVSIVLFLLLCGLGVYAFMLNVNIGDLNRQLTKEIAARQQTDTYLAETRQRLQQTLTQVEQLQTQLQYKPSDFGSTPGLKPPMPVEITFRPSYIGLGLVAVFNNSSDRTLTLVLVMRNPTLATARRFSLELSPHASDSFGYFEGWKFASGDELMVYHNDFYPQKRVVP
jgi:hypothetical protein